MFNQVKSIGRKKTVLLTEEVAPALMATPESSPAPSRAASHARSLKPAPLGVPQRSRSGSMRRTVNSEDTGLVVDPSEQGESLQDVAKQARAIAEAASARLGACSPGADSIGSEAESHLDDGEPIPPEGSPSEVVLPCAAFGTPRHGRPGSAKSQPQSPSHRPRSAKSILIADSDSPRKSKMSVAFKEAALSETEVKPSASEQGPPQEPDDVLAELTALGDPELLKMHEETQRKAAKNLTLLSKVQAMKEALQSGVEHLDGEQTEETEELRHALDMSESCSLSQSLASFAKEGAKFKGQSMAAAAASSQPVGSFRTTGPDIDVGQAMDAREAEAALRSSATQRSRKSKFNSH
eukprot:TRINITY_DN10215_c0_g4_i1.p1 TRINITY_DN10215_c0_g4~~TRINITY_DN10215_c0_g4_i1.p1  ORF type:complete len:352 (-),score=66.52 TRINITY_DN10215_c0_g4_i1:54-1109(-)